MLIIMVIKEEVAGLGSSGNENRAGKNVREIVCGVGVFESRICLGRNTDSKFGLLKVAEVPTDPTDCVQQTWLWLLVSEKVTRQPMVIRDDGTHGALPATANKMWHPVPSDLLPELVVGSLVLCFGSLGGGRGILGLQDLHVSHHL